MRKVTTLLFLLVTFVTYSIDMQYYNKKYRTYSEATTKAAKNASSSAMVGTWYTGVGGMECWALKPDGTGVWIDKSYGGVSLSNREYASCIIKRITPVTWKKTGETFSISVFNSKAKVEYVPDEEWKSEWDRAAILQKIRDDHSNDFYKWKITPNKTYTYKLLKIEKSSIMLFTQSGGERCMISQQVIDEIDAAKEKEKKEKAAAEEKEKIALENNRKEALKYLEDNWNTLELFDSLNLSKGDKLAKFLNQNKLEINAQNMAGIWFDVALDNNDRTIVKQMPGIRVFKEDGTGYLLFVKKKVFDTQKQSVGENGLLYYYLSLSYPIKWSMENDICSMTILATKAFHVKKLDNWSPQEQYAYENALDERMQKVFDPNVKDSKDGKMTSKVFFLSEYAHNVVQDGESCLLYNEKGVKYIGDLHKRWKQAEIQREKEAEQARIQAEQAKIQREKDLFNSGTDIKMIFDIEKMQQMSIINSSNIRSEITKMYVDGEEVPFNTTVIFRTEGRHYVVLKTNGITKLPEGTFYGIKNLVELRLPASLKSIGEKNGAGCPNLADIYCYSIKAPALGIMGNTFYDVVSTGGSSSYGSPNQYNRSYQSSSATTPQIKNLCGSNATDKKLHITVGATKYNVMNWKTNLETCGFQIVNIEE